MNKSRMNLLKYWASISVLSYSEIKKLYKELYLHGNKNEFKERLKINHKIR